MNRKQLLILLVVGAVVGGIGYNLYRKDKDSFQTSGSAAGRKLIPNFPINDVAHVSVRHGTNQVNLVKQDETWRVKERGNYPANFSEIGDFLRKVWDLKPVQEIKVGSSQLGRLELSDSGTNAGTMVDFKDKSEKSLKTLVLGKKYSKDSGGGSPLGGGGDFPVGRYVMVVESQPKVWLINDALTSVEPKPENWLNKDFLKVEKIKAVSVTSTNATNSWKLTRESDTAEFSLADVKSGESYETNKASGLKFALSSPSFNDVLPGDAKPEQTGLDKATTALIQTFDDFTYNVKMAKAPGPEDNYNLTVGVSASLPKERTPGKDEKPEDKEKLDKEFKEKVQKLEEKLKNEKKYENWIFVVNKWTIDPLLKERKDFMADKKEEPPKPGDSKDADISPTIIPPIAPPK